MNYIYEEREPFCTIHGVGSIDCEGRVYTGISYMIECWQKAGGTSHMSGLIDTDCRTSECIRARPNNILVLETGEELAIAIVGNDSGLLAIEVQGPIKSCMVEGDLKQLETVH